MYQFIKNATHAWQCFKISSTELEWSEELHQNVVAATPKPKYENDWNPSDSAPDWRKDISCETPHKVSGSLPIWSSEAKGENLAHFGFNHFL